MDTLTYSALENFLSPRYKHKILWAFWVLVDTNTKYWELFEEVLESQIHRYKPKISRTLWRTFCVLDTNTNYWQLFESFWVLDTSTKYWEPFSELFESQIQTQMLKTLWRTFWVLDTNAPPAFFDRLRILKMHWSDIWVKLHCSIAFAANKLGIFPPQVGDN